MNNMSHKIHVILIYYKKQSDIKISEIKKNSARTFTDEIELFKYQLEVSKKIALDSEMFLLKYKYCPEIVKETAEKYAETSTDDFFSLIFTIPYLTDDMFESLSPSGITRVFGYAGTENILIIRNELNSVIPNKDLNLKFVNLCVNLSKIFDTKEKEKPMNFKVFYSNELKDFAKSNFPDRDYYYEKRIAILNKYFPADKVINSQALDIVGNSHIPHEHIWEMDGAPKFISNHMYFNVTGKEKSLYLDISKDKIYVSKGAGEDITLEEYRK